MTAHRARATVRSAGLVAVAAAAAFSLTACQGQGGGKGDASGPEKHVSGAVASPVASSVTRAASAAGGGAPRATVAASKETPAPHRTQTLPDGSTAEIYRFGAQGYHAKIVNHGSVLATLDANGRDAGLDANDMFIVLTLGGEVHAWMGGGHQGPGTFGLAGGWKAEVTKSGELRYRARIIGHDGVAATLLTNQHDVGLDANGVYIVLSAGGVISAHE
ncbi:hypothetical protein [Streptomyces sp. NPDC048106]|uniref:hypothetical protein n=1 Tax=Streptomyces sp. NPDC048106 TaxID=3155750 RepID=UPI003452B774